MLIGDYQRFAGTFLSMVVVHGLQVNADALPREQRFRFQEKYDINGRGHNSKAAGRTQADAGGLPDRRKAGNGRKYETADCLTGCSLLRVRIFFAVFRKNTKIFNRKRLLEGTACR
jgi:hypothetical protein